MHGRTIVLEGAGSKRAMGGPAEGDDTISTAGLRRVLEYEPRDLTVSVEAGMPWRELTQLLANNRQMVPLDPAFADRATVGGVIAANSSGPRRRLYGTARDMVIGMRFATVDGKVVETGGMVVKNVAGLDMAKLMIGSFGTLAAITVVNFKVFPIPAESRTFAMNFETAAEAFAERDRIIQSPLQPAAIDIINWPSGFRLLLRASGNPRVVNRYAKELPFAKEEPDSIWDQIREFTPRFLAEHPKGVVVPINCKLTEMVAIVERLNVPVIARAGSGVIYAHYAGSAPQIEFGGDIAMMTKVKAMFDPGRLLNRGRLYGQI